MARYRRRRRGGKILTRRSRRYKNYAVGGAYMLSALRDLKQMINVEYKQLYIKLTNSLTGTTPAFFSLVQTTQGDQDFERQGNQIKVTQLYWNALIKIHASATATTFRCIILLDKQANGGNPNGSDLLQDNTVDDNIVSPINVDNKFRFKILYNKVAKLSQEHPIQQFKFFKRLQIPIRYSGASNSVANIKTNNLILVLFSDEATNTPTITHSMKTNFVDN